MVSHDSTEKMVLWSHTMRWFSASENHQPASRVALSRAKPAARKRKVRRSSMSSGMAVSGAVPARMDFSARCIIQACTTAALTRPYEAMPSAQCSGSQAERSAG